MGGMTGEIKYGKVLYLKVFPAIDGRDGGFHRKTTIFSLSEASIGLNETPGAMTFPHWEHDIPTLGTWHSQRGKTFSIIQQPDDNRQHPVFTSSHRE